jgi:dTDP-4-dehydrorhamnose 3,5-epimerase
MRIVPTDLPGVVLVEPVVHRDSRGFFLETYNERRYRESGISATFVQDNHSRSGKGTVRGLHFQVGRMQGKLVRAVAGEMFDVAVDVRRGSPTFGRWIGARLSAENFRQIYIPPGFAHGFAVLSEVGEVEYKCTELYDAAAELAIAWNDPQIGIDWPVAEPLLSAKDKAAPRLGEVSDRLPVYEPD